MRHLSPEDWKYVTYITNGKIYVNRVVLRGILEVAQPVSGNVYKLSDGTKFPVPNDEESEPLSNQATICTSATGPFRRVRTQPGTSSSTISRFGYATASVSPGGLLIGVDLPPKVNVSEGEVAYAYLGTSRNSSTGLVESDVGLQWSPGSSSWAPFIKSGNTFVTSSGGPYGRFSWNGQTTMTLNIIANGRARMTYSGTLAPNSPSTINPYSIDFSLPGARQDGVGNVFKRVTSIAQTTISNTNGSMYTLGWSNLRLGATSTSGVHIWGQSGRDIAEDCVTTKTQVAATGSGSEKVFINLR